MKHTRIPALLSGIFLLGAFVVNLHAQAPASIAGDAIMAHATGGTGTFSKGGYYLFLPADSGSDYQLIGADGISSSSGTYAYSSSDAVGTIDFSDSNMGAGTNSITFQPDLTGQFTLTAGTHEQTGSLVLATGPALPSLTNHSYFLNILAGSTPFVSQGSVIFTTGASGSNYTVTPTSGGIANSSGTYAYTTVNASTGFFSVNDDDSGSSSEYFAFTNSGGGVYLVTETSGAFQTGTFTVSNLIPTMFFMGQIDLASHVEWVQFSDGAPFGYYDVMDFGFPCFYHFDLGFEWYFDANNSSHGCYLYDFSSDTFFYTAPDVFPYLYDFTLNAWLYYFPDPNAQDHYSHNPRYFYNFGTKQIITK
ncbi:MAG TPA: hypothetical protein VG754_06610 [Verrucomicrobiae bacterium]|jgi:hypothetical protein|nr:hypothetical protein [Verrucomicrobiae bacterium]